MTLTAFAFVTVAAGPAIGEPKQGEGAPQPEPKPTPIKPIPRPILPPPGTVAPLPMEYTFTMTSFRITDTRSLHNDTDFVGIAAAVAGKPAVSAPTKPMGDVNNGSHPTNLSVSNIAVGSTEVVDFTYTIVNTGYNANSVEQALKTAVAAAAAKGAGAAGAAAGGGVGAVIGTAAGSWLIGKIDTVIFADCDGTVAAADHKFTGADLAQQTANGTKSFSGEDVNKGTDSPQGCGRNSMYYVYWTISGKPTKPPAKP
jgi:hypothetical protein